MEHRLYRSRSDRMVGGVCGGLGEYLGLDSTWIRLAFLAFSLAGGAGLLVYILMLIVVPENPNQLPATGASLVVSDQQPGQEALPGEAGPSLPDANRTRNVMVFGGIVLAAGVILLLRNLGFGLFDWFDGDLLWPLLLIAGGGLLLWRYAKQQ